MKSRDQAFDKKYDTYVEHPRFGRHPRHTGLNPDPSNSDVTLHGNATSPDELYRTLRKKFRGLNASELSELEAVVGIRLALTDDEQLQDDLAAQLEHLPRIAGTAVVADIAKQKRSSFPVTHYFDVEMVCCSCSRPFIFFAEEQKHWYEVLRLNLHVDCVLCYPCRERKQSLAKIHFEYQRLLKAKKRDWNGHKQLVECAVTLVEGGVFHHPHRVFERVRTSLKSVPPEERNEPSYQRLVARVEAIWNSTSK